MAASPSGSRVWVRALSPTCRNELRALQALHGACLPITYDSDFFEGLAAASARLAAGVAGPPEPHLPDAEDQDVVALVALRDVVAPAAEVIGASSSETAACSVADGDGVQAAGGTGAVPAFEMVGFVTLRIEPSPWWPVRFWRWLVSGAPFPGLLPGASPPAPTAYVMTLGVAEAARGRGVGSLLLEAACHYAGVHRGAEALSLHVLTTNAPALRLYARHAFAQGEHLPGHFVFGGGSYDAYHMERRPLVQPGAAAAWGRLFMALPDGPTGVYGGAGSSSSSGSSSGPAPGDLLVYLPQEDSVSWLSAPALPAASDAGELSSTACTTPPADALLHV